MGHANAAQTLTNIEKTSRSCKVGIRGRRSFILTNFILADRQYVSGRLEDGTLATVKLRDGVRVTPLATDCEGSMVAFAERCTCNRSQARVHDVAQSPKPTPAPAVKYVYSEPVKSFAALRQIVGR